MQDFDQIISGDYGHIDSGDNGIIDCSNICIEESYLNQLGNGECNEEEPNFNCIEFLDYCKKRKLGFLGFGSL